MSDREPSNQSIAEAAPPPIGGRPPMRAWQRLVLIVIVILGCVGLYVLISGWLRSPRGSADAVVRAAPMQLGGGRPWVPPAPEPAPPVPQQPALPRPQQDITVIPGKGVDFRQRAIESPIMAEQPGALPPRQGQDGGGSQTDPTEGAGDDALGGRLRATQVKGVQASILKHPELTITQGTMIPCLPVNPIDSTLPGLVSCRTTENVFGTTGTTVLLPRGTKLVGQVREGLRQGQKRVFVLWTRAETPQHVVISLDSPGTDLLGRAGLEGDIDTHFWERFGPAMLLSFIDTGLQSIALAASGGRGGGGGFNGSASLYNFQNTGQSLAASTLQNTINIPPTLSRDQALPATVFVARDLDFSSVYRLVAQ